MPTQNEWLPFGIVHQLGGPSPSSVVSLRRRKIAARVLRIPGYERSEDGVSPQTTREHDDGDTGQFLMKLNVKVCVVGLKEGRARLYGDLGRSWYSTDPLLQ